MLPGLDSHRQHLGRGFNWLGAATVAARVVDFVTVLIILTFLSKKQVGAASLVISIGMVAEALNGLGTSEALIQARSTFRTQLDTLFWYVGGVSMLVAGVIALGGSPIAALYGLPAIAPYFWLVALKQPLVSVALIPLALMNRDLRYKQIATVNLCATIAAALTRLGLAVAGGGAWALVGGYVASGFYILLGAMLARPFRPRLRFRWAAILPLARFGSRAASANLAEQMFKNIDFLLIGWFYGAAPLAVYRIAFDVAMEPVMAVSTLINRVALPVFARVAGVPEQLGRIFSWSLRRVTLLVAPLIMGLILGAEPLMGLIRDEQGKSYAAAALPLKILAAAAFLRVGAQLLPAVMLVSGRPGLAAKLSATTFSLLTAGILAIGLWLPAQRGIVAVAALWLLVFPPLLIWGARYLRRHWQVRMADLVHAIGPACIGATAMLLAVETMQWLTGFSDARLRLAVVVCAMGLTYAGLYANERRRAA